MSNRRNHSSGGKQCMCNKCGAVANSIAGKTHRRCPGQADAPLRAKHQGLEPAAARGKWE